MSETPIIAPELRELLDMEIADIIAAANEQGFASKDVLFGLAAAVSASLQQLSEDPKVAEVPTVSPADTLLPTR